MTGLPEFTKAELEVMRALWKGGRMSAREIHQHAGNSLGWVYSTTRTTVERLAKKGWIRKQPFHGLNLYEAEVSRARGLAGIIRDLADRILGVDYAPVVSLFSENLDFSADEVEELKNLLETSKQEEDPA